MSAENDPGLTRSARSLRASLRLSQNTGSLGSVPRERERETMTTLCPIFVGFLHKGFRRWNSLFINREDRQVGFGPEADIAHLSGKLPNERLR